MFGLGWGELFILAIIGLVLVGPKQLPEMMKGVARFLREVGKAREDWMNTVKNDDDIRDLHESVHDVKESIKKPFKQLKRSLQEELDREGKPSVSEALDEMTEVYDKEEKAKIHKDEEVSKKP